MSDQDGRPQYGQRKKPEYGALRSQYPANYNPYVYGRPDSGAARESAPQQTSPVAPSAVRRPGVQQAGPMGMGPAGSVGGPRPAVNGSVPHQPRMINGIDVNDPRSNPLYGRWDASAIIAFVLAVFSVPVLPAIMGIISIWRTRTLHMKGMGLAVAAVVLNVLTTVLDVWMMLHGVTTADLYQWMSSQLSDVSGSSGAGISA